MKTLRNALGAIALTTMLAGSAETNDKKTSYSLNLNFLNSLSDRKTNIVDILKNIDSKQTRVSHGFSMRGDMGIGYSIGIGTNNKKNNVNLFVTDYLLDPKNQKSSDAEKDVKLKSKLTARLEFRKKISKPLSINIGLGYSGNFEYFVGAGINFD